MRARKLSTEVRREQLAQAALELVRESGVRRLSVAAVARRVGLVPSALYRHFGSKEDLLDAIPELVKGKLLANVEAVRKESPEAVERLRRLMMRHVQGIQGFLGVPRMMFSDDFLTKRPERKGKMYAAMRAYLSGVELMVREGQKEGKIRRDLKPETAAVVFFGIVQSAGIVWDMSGGKFDMEGHARKAWRIFKRMLVAD
jgi:AcrR family transcriptional regulator